VLKQRAGKSQEKKGSEIMIYLEYERYKARFRTVQKQFEEILLEKEALLTKVLPSAICYDKDVVQTSPKADMMDNYMIALEHEEIDKRLKPFRNAMIDLDRLLELKRRELRESNDLFDKVYVMRYLDGFSAAKISRVLCYSRSQIHRILKAINKKIKNPYADD
jgi:hypothetical protein